MTLDGSYLIEFERKDGSIADQWENVSNVCLAQLRCWKGKTVVALEGGFSEKAPASKSLRVAAAIAAVCLFPITLLGLALFHLSQTHQAACQMMATHKLQGETPPSEASEKVATVATEGRLQTLEISEPPLGSGVKEALTKLPQLCHCEFYG